LTNDKFERGRGADRKGELHQRVKLTADDVWEIRRLRGRGATEKTLADRFRISRGQIGKIIRRENWRHI
jgi:hypothetical protein